MTSYLEWQLEWLTYWLSEEYEEYVMTHCVNIAADEPWLRLRPT